MELERRHRRLPAGYRVYIASDEGLDENPIEICQALDVSASGIRIALRRELPVTAFIHLGIEAGDDSPPLILVAVVRWCRPPDARAEKTANSWLAGLEIQPASDSDYTAWCQLLAGAGE